ncbi:hypothetical protein PR048_029077 [Dryococelus australis]|uniref:Uncharacterized protein n=1 Tax=Dryococelus australis TaxID=614101 RepID=A0ABQ9GCF0_9NEOP|nr:hypothetical protein PR048_029077 [Dryococelus australis]
MNIHVDPGGNRVRFTVVGAEQSGHCAATSPTSVSAIVCWGSAGVQGRGKREIPEKTRRPAASFGTIPKCKNLGATLSAIEPGLPWWKASALAATPPRPPSLSDEALGVRVSVARIAHSSLDLERAVTKDA